MADEKRIATFEWLNLLLNSCKKGSPSTSKKGVTKDELIENYDVEPSLLSNYTSNRLVPREKCVCKTTPVGTIGFNAPVHAIDIQSDGKILVGGEFTKYGNTSLNRIARLNSDGSLDTSFNIGGGFNTDNSIVRCIKILPNNKIMVSGSFNTYQNVVNKDIVRIESNGNLDASFSVGGNFNGGTGIYDMEYYSAKNDIIIITDHISFGNESNRGVIALTANGGYSNMNIFIKTDKVNYFSVLRDGLNNGILYTPPAVEGSTTYVNRVGKMNLTNYTRDTGFNCFLYPTSAYNSNYVIKDMIFVPENNVVLYGIFRNNATEANGTYVNLSLRSIINGDKLTTNLDKIKLNGELNQDLTSHIELLNDNLYICGNFYSISDNSIEKNMKYIAKLSTNGVLDSSFSNNIGFNAMTRIVKKDANGKLLVGGNFTESSNGIKLDYLVRLNTDGTIDKKFLV